MTIEQQVADLTTQTTALLNAVNVQKSFLDTAVTRSNEAIAQAAAAGAAQVELAADQVELAAVQAQASAANAASVSGVNASVQQALAGTSSAAAQAANARDQAIAAWRAAAAPSETLAAMSQTLHSGAVVDTFLYNTSKDSDGGAWRKRCQNTSWYNEPINGKWLGQKINELDARGDNLLEFPQDLSVSKWTKGFCTAVPNAIMSPAGDMTAVKIVEDSSLSFHAVSNQTTMTGDGQMYAFQIYAKAGERTRMRMTVSASASFVAAPNVYFDLVAGTVAGGGGSITPVGDGWYLCQFTATMATGANMFRGMSVGPVPTGGNTNNYQGDGTSGIYAWGAKINKVGELASTYSASPELVVNGKFDAGLAGWSVDPYAGTESVVASNGSAIISGDGTNAANFGQPITCVVGKTYIASIEASGRGSLGCAVVTAQFGFNAVGTANSPQVTSTTTKISFAFTATQTTHHIHFYKTGADPVSIDNVSVKEVTALATPYVPYSQISGYYQNIGDGKFYSLNATYGQTEVFRGNTREFPALAAVLGESDRVAIYDLTKPDAPMWRVFRPTTNNSGADWWRTSRSVTCVSAMNGKVFIGVYIPTSSAPDGASGVAVSDFVADQLIRYRGTASGTMIAGNVADSNIGTAPLTYTLSQVLAHSHVNDIACTTLPGAPVDPATGLPVLTVAVATTSGVSVIRHDGTVVSSQSVNNIRAVGITKRGLMVVSNAAGLQGYSRFVPLQDIGPNFALTPNPLSAPGPSGNDQRYVTAMNTSYAEYLSKSSGGFALGDQRLQVHRLNPFASNFGMVAHITHAYNTGWMVGDVRGAWLADTVAETIAAPEVVFNGTFDTNTNEWAAFGGAAIRAINGELEVRNTTGGAQEQAQSKIFGRLQSNKTYVLKFKARSGTGNAAGVLIDTDTLNLITKNVISKIDENYTFYFTVPASANDCTIRLRAVGLGGTVFFDDISIKEVSPDRSVKSNPLNIVGSIFKAPVADGAQLVSYSRFSRYNYLELPYSSDLDFGTGDFSVMGWAKVSTATYQGLVDCNYQRIGSGNPGFRMMHEPANSVFRIGASKLLAPSLAGLGWVHVMMSRVAGVMYAHINGQLAGSMTATDSVTVNAPLTVGGYWQNGILEGTRSDMHMALWRIGTTVPSADQIAQIYRDELPLFQPNAKCTIDGSTSAVTVMAYDDNTEVLHVGTSWGRSEFKGLTRIASVATTSGSITGLAAGMGAHITGGATSVRYVQPALTLREELHRKEDARRAMAMEHIPFDFDGIAAQTAYPVPYGYTAKGVFVAGSKKRGGPTKDYTVSFDGYRESVNFGVSPGATWVQITANRSI